jgi:glycosyltransferase involved in cell wall biosynthesis
MKIITTAFNGYGKYIPQLMESIKAQTKKPKEVIIVLGKDHGMTEKPKATIVETDLTCLGELINAGMKHVKDGELVLCFNVDDILLPCAVEEIEKVKADVITLKYLWKGTEFYEKGVCGTPEITMEKVADWQKHYMGPSGYLAFKKRKVLDTDFWQWPLLWGMKAAGKTIKETDKPCAEWLLRPESHGSGKNMERAIEFLDIQAEKYISNPKISIFSIVKDEEDMCREAWESVKDADELVICIDDRTTDKTPEIAKEFTDKIYYFKWEDDFAKAKNFAMSKCTGDWVMNLDADCILVGGMDNIRMAVKETECDMIDTTLYPIGRDWQTHVLPKVFKNAIIRYEGKAHEYPVGGKRDFNDYGIKIEYDYSPNHKKDPDRYIRILTKQIKDDPKDARWKYYLAREYYYKQDYKKAIEIFNEYISTSKFLQEKADAYLTIAKCYWKTQQGDKARHNTLKAIEINPNFKEALLFMSEIVWPRHSNRWKEFAECADNSEVLFVRV